MIQVKSLVLITFVALASASATTQCPTNSDGTCSTLDHDSGSLLQSKVTYQSMLEGGSEKQINAPRDGVQGKVEVAVEGKTVKKEYDEKPWFLPSSLQSKEFALVDKKQSCSDLIERLEQIDGQVPTVGNDTFFPPNIESIASHSNTCGDIAQGISESCTQFNHWSTFQDVAPQNFKVIGPSGITFNDIGQGSLANCYFLAALAALAYKHPDIIEDMFVERHLWSENIFKTKWLIEGEERIIVVDNTIPAKNHLPFFTKPSPTGEFWSVILAKAWAKIHGSYKAVEYGSSGHTVAAMTRASGSVYQMSQQTDSFIWEKLVDAENNKYVALADTSWPPSTKHIYGLASGHAYSVLGVSTSPEYGQVVMVYNPWAADFYVGAVPNTNEINGDHPGVFTMKLSEFREAFGVLYITYVMSNYKVAHKTIPANQLNALEVNVSTPGKFWVSTVWPSERIIRPCSPLQATGMLTGESSTTQGIVGQELPGARLQSQDSITFDNSQGGSYNILAETKFPTSSNPPMENVQLVVYAPVLAEIRASETSSEDLSMRMLGPMQDGMPCNDVNIALGESQVLFTLDKGQLIDGVPTYWSLDKSWFAYYESNTWCESGDTKWWVAPQSKWASIKDSGECWWWWKKTKSELQCSSKQLVGPMQNGKPCDVIAIAHGVDQVFTLDSTQPIDGISTYWSLNKKWFVYYETACESSPAKWWVTWYTNLGKIKAGECWYHWKFSKSVLQCSSLGPADLALQMFGPIVAGMPCNNVNIGNFGAFALDKGRLVGGIPTYWSSNYFAYYETNCESGNTKWWVAHKSKWAGIKDSGECWWWGRYSKAELQCSS